MLKIIVIASIIIIVIITTKLVVIMIAISIVSTVTTVVVSMCNIIITVDPAMAPKNTAHIPEASRMLKAPRPFGESKQLVSVPLDGRYRSSKNQENTFQYTMILAIRTSKKGP